MRCPIRSGMTILTVIADLSTNTVIAGLAVIAGLTGNLLTSCTSKPETAPVSYVDTRIGSGGHGHVFVGANVPFGMVQLGPTSIPQEWDWCSGITRPTARSSASAHR